MRSVKLVIGLLCLSLGVLLAQTGGTITGEVKDQSGALVPNATITVTNTATNVARNTQTNTAGIYSFPGLVPGRYQVKAAAGGFQTSVTNDIELQVQQTARVDFALTLGAATQTVEVAANAALLATENATVGTVIEERRIMDLPLNGRSFFSLVALSPNVTYGFTAAAQASGRLGGSRGNLTIALTGRARPGRTTPWTASPTPTSTSTRTSCSRRWTRYRSSRCRPGSIPRSSAGKPDRSTFPPNPAPMNSTEPLSEFLRNDKLDARDYDFSSATRSATNPSPRKRPTARTSTASRWGGRFGFRRCSTERTGCSSCRTTRDTSPAGPRRTMPPC